MSTPSDLTQTGQTLVYGLINAANPSLPNGALSATNTTLGVPAGTGTTPNTSVTVTAIANQGYTGSVTVKYTRLDIQNDVFSVLAPGGATVVNTNAAMQTVSDVVTAINAAYSINLQPSDVSNGSTALVLTNDAGTCQIDIAPGSLTYTGTLSVSITQQQVALSQAVTTTNLNGLTPPASPTPSPAPSPTPSPTPAPGP
jgi:hypothetical protein